MPRSPRAAGRTLIAPRDLPARKPRPGRHRRALQRGCATCPDQCSATSRIENESQVEALTPRRKPPVSADALPKRQSSHHCPVGDGAAVSLEHERLLIRRARFLSTAQTILAYIDGLSGSRGERRRHLLRKPLCTSSTVSVSARPSCGRRAPEINRTSRREITMREVATAVLSGNVTREVELRECPPAPTLRGLPAASSTRRRTGRSGSTGPHPTRKTRPRGDCRRTSICGNACNVDSRVELADQLLSDRGGASKTPG
jgi:hypothetical protein